MLTTILITIFVLLFLLIIGLALFDEFSTGRSRSRKQVMFLDWRGEVPQPTTRPNVNKHWSI